MVNSDGGAASVSAAKPKAIAAPKRTGRGGGRPPKSGAAKGARGRPKANAGADTGLKEV
jgi:hypothetical protein